MRCAQFQPLIKKTNRESYISLPVASSPISPLHQQPSTTNTSNLASILGRQGSIFATSATAAVSSSINQTSTMIRRSQRDTAKHQVSIDTRTKH